MRPVGTLSSAERATRCSSTSEREESSVRSSVIHLFLIKQGVLTAFISIFSDYISVNENAQDPPAETSETEPYNTAGSLSLEASFVNANFAAQVVSEGESSGKKKDRVALGGANPFYAPGPGDDPLASCGFRYRKFDISTDGDEEPVSVLVRTEVDAVIKPEKGQTGADQLVSVKTLLNGPLGSGGYAVDWQKKLDASRGAVAAMEMKNNSAKLGRWALQSILAGADLIKMGCVFLPSSVPASPKLAQRLNLSHPLSRHVLSDTLPDRRPRTRRDTSSSVRSRTSPRSLRAR